LLPDEPSIYPYTALREIPARSLLVFAPHPDDEIFGCGGTVALALDGGAIVRVVVVSDGACAGDPAERERESMAAAQVLAAGKVAPPQVEFWREPDRAVRPTDELIEHMSSAIAAAGAEWVLAPSPLEIHPDHRAVSLAACAALAREPRAAQLVFYEVGYPLAPNALVDITAVLERKAAAMACFGSQLALQRYDEHMLALNRYRSYTLGPQVSHAEALHLVAAGELGASAIVEQLHRRLRSRLGLGGN
jgi:LmbE family N-acetylglucosaminyl deacetylase